MKNFKFNDSIKLYIDNTKNDKLLKETILTLEKYLKLWNLKYVKTLGGGTSACIVLVKTTESGTELILKIEIRNRSDNAFFIKQLKCMMDKPHIYPIVYKHDVDNMIMLMEKIGETLNSLKLSPHTQTEIMFNLVKHHIDKYVEVTDEIKESVMKEMNMWKSEICVTDDKFLQSLLPTYHNYLDAVIKKINWDKICIVHGDLHNLNVLKHKNGTYKLIDPDGSYNTAEFELGKLLGQIVVDAYSTMPIPEYTMTVLKEECQYLAKQSKCNEIDIFKWMCITMVGTAIFLKNNKYTDLATLWINAIKAII